MVVVIMVLMGVMLMLMLLTAVLMIALVARSADEVHRDLMKSLMKCIAI